MQTRQREAYLKAMPHLQPPTERGILFWSSIYIPVVVAMAASQNVRGAITGGPVAISAASAVRTDSAALRLRTQAASPTPRLIATATQIVPR